MRSSGRQTPDPLAIEPLQALAIEHRAALVDRPDVEALDDLVERQDLFLGPGRPAEQREVVDQRLADEPLADVVADRRLALALAHLRPIGIEDEREVGEPRDLVAQGPEQEDVLRCVGQVVLAPDDVRDIHRRVVDDDREVVERVAVGPDDDEVPAQVGDVDLDGAADEVVEGHDTRADPEAQRAPAALRLAGRPLRWGQRRAAADIARRLLGGFLGLAVGLELLGRAEARIGEVVGEEPLGRRRVRRQALHLPIRRVRPTGRLAGHLGSLIPGQAQPVQAVEDVLLELDRAPSPVGVLEAEDEGAAGVPGVEVVEERGPGRPDMEGAGRAGRDPDAVLTASAVTGPGTRWNSAGSASPGRTRTSAAGRRPSVARPIGPSRVSESSDSLRARTVIGAPGLRARASRYDSRPASSSASSVIR